MRGKRTHGSDNHRYTTCFSLVGGDSHALFRWYGRGERGKVSENGRNVVRKRDGIGRSWVPNTKSSLFWMGLVQVDLEVGMFS